MSKKRLSKGVIIPDKDKKVVEVLLGLSKDASDDEFVIAFRQKYPEDWKRVEARYNEYENLAKKGNVPPMAKPYQYVLNAGKGIRARHKKGEDLTEVLQTMNAPKPKFIEGIPQDLEALLKKLHDKGSYEKRIDAIKKLGKYKCKEVIDEFLAIVKTDPVTDVRNAAYSCLIVFGYEISKPRKAPMYVDKDLKEKLIEVANSLHADFSYDRFASKFQAIYPEEYDLHKYNKNVLFKGWLQQQIKQLPKQHSDF